MALFCSKLELSQCLAPSVPRAGHPPLSEHDGLHPGGGEEDDVDMLRVNEAALVTVGKQEHIPGR